MLLHFENLVNLLNTNNKKKNYLNYLSKDLLFLIIQHKAAILIQNNAIKMFYKKYGYDWKNIIDDYEDNLDFCCYLTGINDPKQDYINYYR